MTLTNFVLDLIDLEATVFTSEALPSSPPDLDDFEFNNVQLQFLNSDGFTSNALYTVTSLTLTDQPSDEDVSDDPNLGAVPLPAGLPLILGGLAALGLFGARRRA